MSLLARLRRTREEAAEPPPSRPLLSAEVLERAPLPPWPSPVRSSAWMESCGNPQCRSGWLHLLRSRIGPVFEGSWNCSPECTRMRLAAAARAELSGRLEAPVPHRHRVPLGLLMLEQGWISKAQLRQAVQAQRTAGGGRLGQWLLRQQSASERTITRALGLQWSCPVFPLEYHDAEALAGLIPRLFIDAFGVLPLRVGGGKILYVGFEEHLDPVLAFAVERMMGLRVESGLIEGSQFRPAHTRMLAVNFPPVELIEAQSEPAAVQVMARAIEKFRPVDSRLVRVHDCLWLRLWRRPQRSPLPECAQLQDLICSIGSH